MWKSLRTSPQWTKNAKAITYSTMLKGGGWTQEKHTTLVIGHHITQTYTNMKEEIRHHPAYKQQRVKTNRTSQLSRKWKHGIRNIKTNTNNSKCTTPTLLLKTRGELERSMQHLWTSQETNWKYEQYGPHQNGENEPSCLWWVSSVSFL